MTLMLCMCIAIAIGVPEGVTLLEFEQGLLEE
jgi:hypothetical protein